MTVMAEVFGYLPHFNLFALYLKTVEKNRFFVPDFRQLPFIQMFKGRKRHGSSGRGSRTDNKARSKQGNGHCASRSFVSLNMCCALKINVHYNINFSVLLDLWLLDNT